MPTYEYECRKCGHKFEKFQSMSAEPVKTCPQCRARKVARLLSGGAGIIFKGSGFYQTDYKKTSAPASEKSGEKTAEKGSEAPKPAESKSEGAKKDGGKAEKKTK
jgi:putative FmdB family regulatory protein